MDSGDNNNSIHRSNQDIGTIEGEKKHTRPKIQRKFVGTKNNENKSNVNNNNNVASNATAVVQIENTRKRMESWMGLGEEMKRDLLPAGGEYSSVKEISSSKREEEYDGSKPRPASILRTPKYKSSTDNPTIVSTTSTNRQCHKTIVDATFGNNCDGKNNNTNGNNKKFSHPIICKDIVIERDPTEAVRKIKSFRNKTKTINADVQDNWSYQAIEGYIPETDTGPTNVKFNSDKDQASNDNVGIIDNDKKNDDNTNNTNDENDGGNTNDADDPLVIDSLTDLIRAAGQTLPENTITEDTKMVEADISFSVMTKDQYKSKLPVIQQEQEEERRQQLEVFMGRHDIFDDSGHCDENNDNSRISGDSGENYSDDDEEEDDEDDDAVMELLMGSDVDIDNNNDDGNAGNSVPEIRAFTLLWNALINWMTPETVTWVKTLRDNHGHNLDNNNSSNSMKMDSEWSPIVDRSDIGTSRCAGVMAMIRLYLRGCMNELDQQPENKRKAEKRLNDVMRTFDYTQDNPKLAASHWKVMACILLDMVLIETRSEPVVDLPPSVSAVGMTLDEFQYLSRKAVLTFDTTTTN